MDQRCRIAEVPRVLNQTVPVGRLGFKRNVLALELTVAVSGSCGVEVQHAFGCGDDRAVFVEGVRP